jgi:hypothetical protein
MRVLWAPKWYSKNRLDGVSEYLMWDEGLPALFRTRRECRDWISFTHGYIREREDLRTEPHGWRLPRPVRVEVVEMKR